MNKPTVSVAKVPATDVSKCNKSTFTLSFAIEVINQEIWSDHKEGWVDLGPCLQRLKLNSSLYNGQNFEINVGIYEQVARITCGPESCWVRTWQFLERRWLTFTISHAFPVRVADLRDFEAYISVNTGSDSGVKISQLYFPPLNFGQRRYFAEVVETLPTAAEVFLAWIRELIWNLVIEYIPSSSLDGVFNVPHTVSDIRHQNTILYKIQEETLNSSLQIIKGNNGAETPGKPGKKKDKSKNAPEKTFGLRLSGDTILAGSGRIVAFEMIGERPPEIGEVIVLLSSGNLPAHDDVPIVFINIGHLFDAPLEEFKKLNITHIYTQWTLGDEVHDSEKVEIESIQRDVDFRDSHALPLNPSSATEITARFLDNPYHIQLRGIKKNPVTALEPKLFGFDKDDRDFGFGSIPPMPKMEQQQDYIIAMTKIDARALARGINSFIKGEYPLFPPRQTVPPLSRQGACTNDINLIGVPLRPEILVPTSVILNAQMSLEVSLGVVGCKPPKITSCFSRLFCILSNPNDIMDILLKVRKINDELADVKPMAMLTGFALDTSDTIILYVEGPRDGNILKVWDMTEEYYPRVKPVFSTSARFTTRIYPEFLEAIMPFLVLKTYAPLGLLLACPSVYARPALPIPARIAALKFGRLLQQRYRVLPARCELPTAAELWSFRLELCAPPRTYPVILNTHEKAGANLKPRDSITSHCNKASRRNSTASKINWDLD